MLTALKIGEQDVKLHSNGWRRCENYTRNEWRRSKNYTRNEWGRFRVKNYPPLGPTIAKLASPDMNLFVKEDLIPILDVKLHSKRVEKM
jgi:hypothetical protein